MGPYSGFVGDVYLFWVCVCVCVESRGGGSSIRRLSPRNDSDNDVSTGEREVVEFALTQVGYLLL